MQCQLFLHILTANVEQQLKEIVNFSLTSVEGFNYDNIPWCVGESPFYCRFQYMLDSIDARYPGNKILSLWFPSLQTTTTSTASPFFDTSNSSDEGAVDFNDFITESPNDSSEI